MIRSKLVLIIFLIIIAVFAIMYFGTLPITIFLATVLIVFISFLITFFTSKKVNFDIQTTPSSDDGSIEYIIIANNNSIFPVTYSKINLVCKNRFSDESAKKSVYFTIPSKSNKRISGNIQTDSAGSYMLEFKKAIITDWFRIFSFKVKNCEKTSFCVWPKEYRMSEKFFLSRNDMSNSDQFSDDIFGDIPGDFSGVRDYHEGDRLQYIHWKLSAKKDDLAVKEFALPLNTVSILLDFSNAENKTVINAMADISFSIANHCIEYGIIFEFAFLKGDTVFHQTVKSRENVYEIFNKLLLEKPNNEDGFNAVKSYQFLDETPVICVCASENAKETLLTMSNARSILIVTGIGKNLSSTSVDNLQIVEINAEDVENNLAELEN